ncbi:MAG: hypothetical protein ACK5K7_06760 [Bacilli bacterium]
MKKLILSALSVFMVATIGMIPLKSVSASSDESDSIIDSRSNNRYYYKTEYGSRSHLTTRNISQKEASSSSNWRTVVGTVIGLANNYGTAAVSTVTIANAIYGMNAAGTIKVYKTPVRRYKVHRSTGKKILVSSYYKIEVEARYLNGNLYKKYTYNTKSR